MTLSPEKRVENTSVIVFINNERKISITHSAVNNWSFYLKEQNIQSVNSSL